jgi:tetratricopeptide (TPR) repeat protein
MKKNLILLLLLIPAQIFAQTKSDYSKIDMMLIKGDYNNVIDSCKQILLTDSLNADIYYKMGLAYQNLMAEDKSMDYFLKAAELSPENKNYSFTVAKYFYNKGKLKKAEPILENLCASDSSNWPYAYYLTSIYMQEQKYNESIETYYRFYRHDYNNYMFTDKIGFAYLMQGDFIRAIAMYNRSLKLNPKNLNAIKNLAYLYAGTIGADTATKLLTKGIMIDSTDMDLYARRGAINYTISNFRKALKDYDKLLASGDSSSMNLKRAGIGYAKDNQPKKAIWLLLKAHEKDTADMETISALAQNYNIVEDYKKSAYYYRTLLERLAPYQELLGLNNLLLAEVLKKGEQYKPSINAYLKSQEYRSDVNIYMIIANIYDEKLNDIPNAIRYYELYLKKLKSSNSEFDADYTDSVRKRIDSLKKMQQKTQ